MPAAIDDVCRKVIADCQNEIAKSIVDAERERTPEMLARPARELALDPQDADIGAAPMGGRREIVKITQG